MTLNRDPVSPLSPSRDFLTRQSIPSVVVGTLALSLLVLLATYILGGFHGVSGNGVAALIFGVIASFALGIGLMVAVFYSSRKYDEAAHYAAMDQFTKQPGSFDEPTERPNQAHQISPSN